MSISFSDKGGLIFAFKTGVLGVSRIKLAALLSPSNFVDALTTH